MAENLLCEKCKKVVGSVNAKVITEKMHRGYLCGECANKKEVLFNLKELEALKGVGKISALKLSEKAKSWTEIKSNGLLWLKSILKDDVAEIIWKEANK